jgi:N-dimethylarginine dimethylaminohydrolase
MGDPAHFAVRGGANPHTRDRWGRRKRVDGSLAIRQWNNLRSLLLEYGFRIHVLPPDPSLPGLVYPANAGVRLGDDFILSNLTPTRASERTVYEHAATSLGLRRVCITARFEGEADFFPAGSRYLFTFGDVLPQRFVPAWSLPPWRRVYGFRSDEKAAAEIEIAHPLDRPLLRLRLVDERYYHGDTCLCSFGSGRASLLAYLDALDPGSRPLVKAAWGDDLVEIDKADAEIYAANSFAFSRAEGEFMVVPEGISERLTGMLSERGVSLLKTDVSEFLKKGGGSVKCMIGDLGLLDSRITPARFENRP